MRNWVGLLLLTFLAGCQERPAALAFNPPVIDLGKLYSGQICKLEVKLENNGDQLALLKKVSGTCTCMTLHGALPKSVAPHGAAEITATFDSLGSSGNISRNLMAEQEPTGAVLCEVRGQVYETIKYTIAVNVLQIPPGKTVRRSFPFEARQLDTDSFHIAKISSSDEQTLKAVKWTDTPLRRGQKGEVEWAMTTSKLGQYHETLWLELDEPAKLKVAYDVYAYVEN